MAQGENEVSDVPVTVSETTVAATERSDVKEMTISQQYQAPLDGSHDPRAAADLRLARFVAQALVKHFYGYIWHVIADSAQGVVCFAIPDLMGPTLKWVIRLPEHPEMWDRLIMRFGGELLERMHLKRGPMDPAQYEWAKQNRHLFHFGDVKQ